MNKKNRFCKFFTVLVCAVFLVSCGTAQQPGADSGTQQGSGKETAVNAGSDGNSNELKVVSLVSMKDVTYDNEDYYSDWTGENPIYIKLNGTSATINGAGAVADGSKITISAAGVYVISGKLDNGQIIVDSEDKGTVRLVLNGMEIQCNDNAPVYIKNAEKAIITLEKGTQNIVSDGENYTFSEAGADEPNAAIFSKADLTVNGSGALTIHGNYNNGITGKDDLRITGGTIQIYSTDDGIMGKDTVLVNDGTITIEAGGDGIKSTNDTDNTKGFVALEGGTFVIKSGSDAIQAVTSVMITNGVYDLTTGGGSANGSNKAGSGRENGSIIPGSGRETPPERTDGVTSTTPAVKSSEAPAANTTAPAAANVTVTEVATVTAPITPKVNATVENDTAQSQSSKGIKSSSDIVISGGTFTIDSSDDAMHSNNAITITDGKFTIASGDDGIHADSAITINSGKFNITKSYEGIESNNITVSGGDINVVASDDGINAAGGNDGSSINGRPGQNTFSSTGDRQLKINSGHIAVSAAGDGLDVNGSIYMTSGTVLINGPTNSGNGALDYDGVFEISGGLLVAAGSAGMVQAPSEQSTQYTVAMNFSNIQQAGTIAQLEDSSGKTVVTFKPDKVYQSIIISSPELKKDSAYTFYSGGSSSGSVSGGLYTGGSYQGGTKIIDLTIAKAVTWMSETGETTGGGFNHGGFNKGGSIPGGVSPDGVNPDGANPGGLKGSGSDKKPGGFGGKS